MNQSNDATSDRLKSQTPQKPEKRIPLKRLILLLLFVCGFILFILFILLTKFLFNYVANSIIQPGLDSFYDFIHQRWVLGVIFALLVTSLCLSDLHVSKYDAALVIVLFQPYIFLESQIRFEASALFLYCMSTIVIYFVLRSAIKLEQTVCSYSEYEVKIGDYGSPIDSPLPAISVERFLLHYPEGKKFRDGEPITITLKPRNNADEHK